MVLLVLDFAIKWAVFGEMIVWYVQRKFLHDIDKEE